MKSGLQTLLTYQWKYRKLVLPGLLLLLSSDAGQLIAPLIVARIIDVLTAPQPSQGAIDRLCWMLFGVAAWILASRFLWRHFMFSAARLAEMEIRNRLLEQVLRLPSAYFTRTRTGEVMALATNDLISVRTALAMGIVAGFDSSVLAAATLVIMAWMDWRLTLWTVLPFPLLALVMAVGLSLSYKRWDAVQKSVEHLTEKVRESLAGMRVLKAYVQEGGDLEDFERTNRANYESNMAYVRIDALYQPAIVVLAGSSVAILIAVGGADVVSGQLSLGKFNAFMAYLGMLTWPMIAAGWMVSLVQRGAVSMGRIQTMLALPAEDAGGAELDLRGALEARHMTFTYPGAAAPALVDFSFRLEPGQSLGIVGEVGSGKSTLALLLGRIYDPPAGTLFLDGQDVLEISLSSLRRAVSWVPQEAFLFSETIEENLRLGHFEAAPDELRRMAAVAALEEEILEFPGGYETMLGERGITLSGGQKQRLCLARALLKPAPVIVLDDTLSAVDSESERAILAELRGALAGRTAVVISHRASSVRDLDHILVLEGGRIVQQGRHAELLAQGGYYKDMVELQELEQ
ncbi:ABC transporter ATP-binding protein [bacterium CPR1]|nr:ABC transporter ATP-binding protein [bacterium CPR1]